VTRRAAALLGAAALALAGLGCGGGGGDPLTVSAASSLKKAFERYGREAVDPQPRFSFAGSDELAAQIRQGVRPDVYAAANTRLPDELFAAGLVERPVRYAGNRLVIAVPSARDRIRSLEDLMRAGTKIVVGAASVPAGSYTQTVLDRLDERRRRAISANVRSREPAVAGVVGKLVQGAADAGFVYITDVVGAGGRLRAIELPARLQPRVVYAGAVVRGAKRPAAARRFIEGLLEGRGPQILAAAGFDPPPPAGG
jgi:molybdate transport system substrate-binding protein